MFKFSVWRNSILLIWLILKEAFSSGLFSRIFQLWNFIIILVVFQKYFFFSEFFTQPFLKLDTWSSAFINLTLIMMTLIYVTSHSIAQFTSLFVKLYLMMLMTLCVFFMAEYYLLFYFMFESSLIPVLWMIMGWGYQPERTHASYYMMLYTIGGSLPFLMCLTFIYVTTKEHFYFFHYSHMQSSWTLLHFFFLFPFLVKLPIFSMHLWLPKAHTEAPVFGSMLLAALLLKMGAYGVYKFMMLSVSYTLIYLISSVSLIGGVLTAMVCLQESDLKVIIAYSSIGHMGIACASLLTYSYYGELGSLVIFVAHGFSSSLMFYFSSKFYSMTHTRNLLLLKGSVNSAKSLIMLWFLSIMACMSAPPSVNFFGEIFSFISLMKFWNFNILISILSIFLVGIYSIWIYSITHHGVTVDKLQQITPMTLTEKVVILGHLVYVFSMILTMDFIN